MLDIVLFAIAFVVLMVGTYTDLRTREIPDWVNSAGIIAGFGIRSIWSATTADWAVLGWGIVGFAVFFVISVVMYYTGQWGGGDSKLLMALGVLLGFGFSTGHVAIVFLLWTLLAGACYGLVWSMVLALRTWNKFVTSCKKLVGRMRWAHVPVLAVFVFGVAFAIASDELYFRILMLIVALSVPVLFYLAIAVKAVEQCCMYKQVIPANLTEGDWIAQPVSARGKYICGPKDLGITKAQIQQLKRLKVRHVLVKEGIPFTPSFLIAFVLALWLGNPFVFIV